jgi:hypothetical protein
MNAYKKFIVKTIISSLKRDGIILENSKMIRIGLSTYDICRNLPINEEYSKNIQL